MDSHGLIQAYYDRFNAGDIPGLVALLDPEVVHEVSQSKTEIGTDAFFHFLQHMEQCYQETVSDLVIMTTPGGERAAAEFQLDGIYRKRDGGFPEAHGQSYRLRVGAFFAIRDGRIARVSNHYNLQDWLTQVMA